MKRGIQKNFRGVTETNGLFFIGLPWMYTRGSATLGGVSKDADYLMGKITNEFTPTIVETKKEESEMA